MVEIEATNPPPLLPPNFVSLRQLRDRRLMEPEPEAQAQPQAQLPNPFLGPSARDEESGKRPLLPPNYVSLRQLRERCIREEQSKGKEEEEGDGPTQLAPGFVPLRRLEEEKEGNKGNKSDNRAMPPPNRGSPRRLQEWRSKEEKKKEEECGNLARVPPNYVSLRKLQEQHAIEKEKEREEEAKRNDKGKGKAKEKEEEKMREGEAKRKYRGKGKAKEEKEEKGRNGSNLPPNYISLLKLKELRLKEKENTKEAEEAAVKIRLQQIEEHEKANESVRIEVAIDDKTGKLARKPQSMKQNNLGHTKCSLAWQPVLSSPGSSTETGNASADVVLVPEEAVASSEVLVISSDQKGYGNSKYKKGRKKHRKINLGKKIVEVGKAGEGTAEAAGVKIEDAAQIFTATKELAASRTENNAVQKEGNVNLTESSSQSFLVHAEVKEINEGKMAGFKINHVRHKRKGKKVILTEPNHNSVPGSEVPRGSEGVENVINDKTGNGEANYKDETASIPESNDQTTISEEPRGLNCVGEVIRLEIQKGKEMGRGRSGNGTHSKKWRGPVGLYGKKQAAGISGRERPWDEKFTRRAGDHLEGGCLVWVPKKIS